MEGHQSRRGSPVTTRVMKGYHIAKRGGQDRREGRNLMRYLSEQSFGLGGEVNQEKNRGRSSEVDTMKFSCRITRSRGRSVFPAMAMVRLLEATMAEY